MAPILASMEKLIDCMALRIGYDLSFGTSLAKVVGWERGKFVAHTQTLRKFLHRCDEIYEKRCLDCKLCMEH